jgi:hypothetical protein
MSAIDRPIFVRHEPPEASAGLQIFCGLVIVTAALVCGFVAGMAFASWLQERQREMDARKGPPPRVVPQRHDPLAAYCKAPQEFSIMCRARARSDKTRM